MGIINWLRHRWHSLFCDHEFILMQWGGITFGRGGIPSYYSHLVKIGCVHCGCVRKYYRDNQEFELTEKEAMMIAVRLLGSSKWK